MSPSLVSALARSTRNAVQSVPIGAGLTDARQGVVLGRGGLDRQLGVMESVGTMFSIVTTLASGTAGVEWALYRKRPPGADPETPRDVVTSHPALSLWDRPNQAQERHEFVEAQEQHIELVGESCWIVLRRGGLPFELWSVRPDRMAPVPGRETFLLGWIYTSPGGERVPLEPDDVIQLKMPNPRDPYRGLGPVQSILSDIDAASYSAAWNRNFFLNSAEPGGIIKAPSQLGDKEWNRLRQQWRDNHQGVANAHRVAILENGLEWVDRQMSMRDMQFVELRTVSSEIMREAYGVSKTMQGLSEDVNRATADTAEYIFAKWRLRERLDRINRALNFKLLPMFGSLGQGVEFDYDLEIPRDDAAEAALLGTRSTAAVALINAGFEATSVIEALELPEMKFEGRPAPAPAPGFGEPPSQPPPAPDAPAPGVDPADEPPAPGGEPT